MGSKSSWLLQIGREQLNMNTQWLSCLSLIKIQPATRTSTSMYPDRYSRITLVIPNYEAAPRLFYLEYFWQRYMTCDSAAHQELPMGKIFPEILDLWELRKFCDDPASRSANWDQVNKIFSQFQRNL